MFDAAADALGRARAAAAEELDAAMAKELAPLKLERAKFATEITEAEAGPEGRDQVAFTVATNPGAPAGPLNKIASGGELSRFLLALKVCLTAEADGLTMIFDEIDRGVGGATADAVGRRLEALAAGSQVLVVTHSPQVAARGAHHWQVAKRVIEGERSARLSRLKMSNGSTNWPGCWQGTRSPTRRAQRHAPCWQVKRGDAADHRALPSAGRHLCRPDLKKTRRDVLRSFRVTGACRPRETPKRPASASGVQVLCHSSHR